MKIIYGYLIFSVFTLLFFTGGILLGNLVLRFDVTVDWLTFLFLLANFGALGSFAVFFTAPSTVKQGYLVCVSVIMAWSLSKMPEWTNWTILIALAVYDLFAVLSPCGPLKALVEMSQSRNESIPGLVYEADAPESRAPPAPPSHSPNMHTPAAQADGLQVAQALDDAACNRDSLADAGPRQRCGRAGGSGGSGTEGGGIEMQQVVETVAVAPRATDDAAALPGGAVDGHEDAAQGGEEEEREGGVKLGLGDFVFYSVLVARCAPVT